MGLLTPASTKGCIPVMNSLLLLVVGFFSGILASMGFGGGVILLIYLTLAMNIPQEQAQFINLLFFIPIGTLSIILHKEHHLIEKAVVYKACLAGVVGVIVGAFLATTINTRMLSKGFGILIGLMGLSEVLKAIKNKNSS